MADVSSPSPIAVLREATKRYRGLKYAWGVLGLTAVLAIVKAFGLSGPATALTLVVLLALMGVMVVFQALANSKSASLHRLGNFLGWVTTLAFAFVLFLLIFSTFFDYPKPLTSLAGIGISTVAPDEKISAKCGADSVRSNRFGDCVPPDFVRIDMQRVTLGQAKNSWYLNMDAALVPLGAGSLLVNDVLIVANAVAKKDGAMLALTVPNQKNLLVNTQAYPLAIRNVDLRWTRLGQPVDIVPSLGTHWFSLHVSLFATNQPDGRKLWLTFDIPQPAVMSCGHECVAVGKFRVSAGAAERQTCNLFQQLDASWKPECLVSEQ